MVSSRTIYRLQRGNNYSELAEYLRGIIADIPQNATDDMYLNRVIDPIEDIVSAVPSVSNIKVDDSLMTKTAATLHRPARRTLAADNALVAFAPLA